MTYEQIRDKIESDYAQVMQARVITSRGTMKTFYMNFASALEELHQSVGPFIVSKEQFIEHIKYIKTQVNPEVYDAIITYCHDSLKLTIE